MNNQEQLQLNLDRLAARHAQEIIKYTANQKASDVEDTVTKALAVLQGNGVYACFLYLLAKEGKNGLVVADKMLYLLSGLGFGWNKPSEDNVEEILKHISENVTKNLERLLLARETLEQMLIYARYGAKARSDNQSTES